MRRSVRVAIRLAVSAAIIALLVWQIDVDRTVDLVVSSNVGYLAAALAIYIATTWAMAWRWQLLLASKGIHEPIGWLTKLYFVGYAAGPALGAAAYNLAHNLVFPIGLGAAGVVWDSDRAVAVALVWLVHIGVDRAIGYGLKYPTAFKDTHIQRV